MFETKLQMRLDSGEPKCANCAAWERRATVNESDPPAYGLCLVSVLDRVSPVIPHEPLYTTDLQVCSKWQQKK